MRNFIFVAFAVLAFASAVTAAPCRDFGGKFIKCPVAVVL